MSIRFLLGSALIVAAALAGGCSDDGKPCDHNQNYERYVCVPKPIVPEAGPEAGPEMDAEVADGEITDAAAETTPAGMFGTTCTMSGDSAECAAPAPYCAVQPGATMGYCTATDCKANPSICPPGWTCFDITAINLNFCFKPLTP